MSRIVDYPAVLGQRLFPLDCESDKTNVTLQTWSVCLLDSHSFPKRQEKVPLFTYILCQESGISPALRASTNDQEIFWVDEHRGKSRGKKEKRKCGSLKKISPLTTLCLSSPPGHSSRPAQRSPPPVRPPRPSSVPFQSIASLLEYTAYRSNHMFYIKWGLWAFKQSAHQYNAWCTVKQSMAATAIRSDSLYGWAPLPVNSTAWFPLTECFSRSKHHPECVTFSSSLEVSWARACANSLL